MGAWSGLVQPMLLGVAMVGATPLNHADPSLRYAPDQLDCAGFRETSRGTVETYTAGQARRETVGLDAVWRFRAKPVKGDSVHVEAWFDTLSVWRRTAEGNLEPDTDPVIGGRYLGVVSRDGHYRADARPFVPDDLAEVADLSRALDDLLPRLPPQAVSVGSTWTDGSGLELRRLADSAGVDSVLQFRLTLRRDTREGTLRGDSTPLRLNQRFREDGAFAWHVRRGLLRRDRHITIETEVPPEPRVRRPVRARVEQTVVLERIADTCETASSDR